MTELLDKAFAQAAQLTDEDQNTLAYWILEFLEDEQRWDEAFANSADSLAKLADEALADYRAGNTQELDPETL